MNTPNPRLRQPRRYPRVNQFFDSGSGRRAATDGLSAYEHRMDELRDKLRHAGLDPGPAAAD
jgi:hypothetical protein